MAKSLKEALLERFADLQELGIAPSAAPVEDEGPSVVVEMGPESRRDAGGRRQRAARASAYDDENGRLGDVPVRRSRPRRQERGDRTRPGPERTRRPERTVVDEFPPVDPATLQRSEPVVRAPADRARTERPPFAGRPSGPRPPMADRSGPRRFGPQDGGPRPPGTTDRLRERAEQRRRDDELRNQLQQVVSTASGSELDPEAFSKFLNDLTQEVGALPPLERVIEAVQMSNSVEPFKVGEQIRLLYRRPRPRVAAATS
jgi:hypothetical protein